MGIKEIEESLKHYRELHFKEIICVVKTGKKKYLGIFTFNNAFDSGKSKFRLVRGHGKKGDIIKLIPICDIKDVLFLELKDLVSIINQSKRVSASFDKLAI